VALSKIPISRPNAERTLAVDLVSVGSSETTICRLCAARTRAVDLANAVSFVIKTNKLYVVLL
jgi:hypothetical protein